MFSPKSLSLKQPHIRLSSSYSRHDLLLIPVRGHHQFLCVTISQATTCWGEGRRGMEISPEMQEHFTLPWVLTCFL